MQTLVNVETDGKGPILINAQNKTMSLTKKHEVATNQMFRNAIAKHQMEIEYLNKCDYSPANKAILHGHHSDQKNALMEGWNIIQQNFWKQPPIFPEHNAQSAAGFSETVQVLEAGGIYGHGHYDFDHKIWLNSEGEEIKIIVWKPILKYNEI